LKWEPTAAVGGRAKVTKLLLSLVAISQENAKKYLTVSLSA
jgi:hypothetical protein